MRNPFKDLPEEEKRKALNRMLWTFGITVFILGWVGFFIHLGSNNQIEEASNYTFFLGEEQMNSIMVCEENWHYELIDEFVPCVVNETVGGIGGDTLDWTLSPQENCHNVDGYFPGLNLVNETRAKELYDQLIPSCFEFFDNQISWIWLNASSCECEGFNYEDSYYFVSDCDTYDCGGGLIVKKKNA